ncbi:MAG: PepSY-like domain-containing protein [Bacteroidetes bacterium]|nr:PepSY-like domain-containing protein [Bacteroidota bacterium]
MKALATVLCVACVSYASAQKITAEKVPAAINTNFKKQFSKAEKVQWELDEKNYEVNFHQDKKELSAKYSADAEWLETEEEISMNEVPAAVKQALEKEFGTAKIDEAEKVSRPNHVELYEFEIKSNKQKIEAQFSTDGKLLKREIGK